MSKDSKSLTEPYPYNLLYAIFEDEDEVIPIEPEHDVPADFCGSMEYMLATLSPRERDILHLRYAHGMTLAEIAQQQEVGRERIRQIEAKAIRKLRHPTRLQYIKTGVQGMIRNVRERVQESAYHQGLQEGKASMIAELNSGNDESPSPENSALIYTIEELDLSVRAYNCLKRAGYKTVADIMTADRDKLMKTRNLGQKCYDEVCGKLESLGLDVKELRFG